MINEQIQVDNIKINENFAIRIPSPHEEIKENRKFINFLFRSLNQIKHESIEILIKECVKLLSNRDIIRIYDEDKNNFVHICAKQEKLEYLKALVEAYRVLLQDDEKFYEWFTIENNEKMTPLDIACQFSNKEIIKYIYSILERTNESKLKLIEKRNNLFHYAAKCNQPFSIIFFYEKIHKIFKNKNICIINQSNQLGITPLHYACYFGCRRVIDILLDFGADINARDQDGATCLHYAINKGCIRTIKKLILRGVDKNIKKNDGKSAYDIALSNNQTEIAKILEQKNICRKYFCMDSGIEAFKPTRNDLFLVVTFIIVILLKLIYICKLKNLDDTKSEFQNPLDNFPFLNNENEISNLAIAYIQFKNFNCMFDKNCIFETTITFTTLGLDIFILFMIIYFMICDSKSHNKKENNSRSLIVLFYI